MEELSEQSHIANDEEETPMVPTSPRPDHASSRMSKACSISVAVKAEDVQLQETARLLELRQSIERTENPSATLIKSRPKKRRSVTQRGSKYRGVSKNGRKWQVRTSLI